jgi:hypothetical protein
MQLGVILNDCHPLNFTLKNHSKIPFLKAFGVKPVFFLKKKLKFGWSEKPTA